MIWGQSHIGFLGPVRTGDVSGGFTGTGKYYLPDQGVDFGRLDIVQLPHRVFNLPLVRLEVGDENEGVVILDLLHRRLGVQRSRPRSR